MANLNSIRFLGGASVRKRCAETGSIMLEVVAVLALMGVMGAMLFRQIYQRNQELHNIQMASEIRTVKEAFSAYIQTNKASLMADPNCPEPASIADVEYCTIASSTLGSNIVGYLPDGWFDIDSINNAYTFTMWRYKQAGGRSVIYGIVVPQSGTFPSSGWNFKRAARVALLVGADGGAYGSGITSGSLVGSMGSWELDYGGASLSTVITDATCSNVNDNCNVYVAITSQDIFSPEFDKDDTIKVAMSDDFAFGKLHAYNYFAVGNDTDCYSRKHQTPDSNVIQADTVNTPQTADCDPIFWVGTDDTGNPSAGALGNVYVVNDLNVGADTTGAGAHALKLTKEGVIKQKDGVTIDKDGRIIAKDTTTARGELEAGEHYVVDPAYTSTMNDIRLTSRGGVRLSDILPNYILKDTYTGSCTLKGGSGLRGWIGTTGYTENQSWCDVNWVSLLGGVPSQNITRPTCPEGYRDAFVITPTYFGQGGLSVTKSKHKHYTTGTGAIVTYGAWTDSDNDNTVDDGEPLDVGFVSNIDGCQFFVSMISTASAGPYNSPHGKEGGYFFDSSATYNNFKVTAGYYSSKNISSTNTAQHRYYICENMVKNNEEVHLVLQTYCVAPDLTGAPTKERSSTDCINAGFEWVAASATVQAHCKYRYHLPNINAISDKTKKASACKAAGWVWNNAGTGSCACPAGKTGNYCS